MGNGDNDRIAAHVASAIARHKIATGVVALLLGGGVCAGLELSLRIGDTEIHVHDLTDDEEGE